MSRRAPLLHVLLLASGFGWWIQADCAVAQSPRLYSGSLSLHYFGNDTSTRATPPFDARTFVALPLGARCNPAISGGMTCDPTVTLQMGAPLTGRATALVGSGSPVSIMLAPSQLVRVTSGSLPPRYASQVYQKTYANLANAAGIFRKGGGPRTVSYELGPATGFRIAPGKNQFGGVMRLLAGTPSGALGTKVRYSVKGKGYVGNFPTWGAQDFGDSANPYVYRTFYGTFHSTRNSHVATVAGWAHGWPWTTGTVSVSATGDFDATPPGFPERLVRAGYDNRSPHGAGTIQLVTPHLTSWGDLPSIRMGAIGVLRLKFVPEPSGLALLLAGAGMLGVIRRRPNVDGGSIHRSW